MVFFHQRNNLFSPLVVILVFFLPVSIPTFSPEVSVYEFTAIFQPSSILHGKRGDGTVSLDLLNFEALDDRHNLRNFSCGNSSIDHFFKHAAYYDQALGLSQTTVVMYQDQVIGFYSARCTKVDIEVSEASSMGIEQWEVPAVEVAYLGVDVGWQRKGVGRRIMDYIIAAVTDLARRVGCRHVFVKALNIPELIQWYADHDFTRMKEGVENLELVPMRLLVQQRYRFPEY